jgi:Recombinational DNA repair protein (RecF pathway)
MGFGIDLSECALTGSNDSLEWVSPKSGRAVSSTAGKKWSKKLLKIPPFLLNLKQDVSISDLIDGLNLTGYFLNKQIYSELNRELPSSRKKIIDSLNS